MRFMRYLSVVVVTLVLIALVIGCSGVGGADVDLALFFFILVFTALFFLSLPIIAFWIYSFFKSVRRRTRTDRILLYFHVVDLLLIGLIVYLANNPKMNCNAKIMAEHYDREGAWMRNIARCERLSLPDSTSLVIEFGESKIIPEADYLDERYLHILKNQLDDVGCIGLEIDNYHLLPYTAFRFRRKGMGMYSFRLYDKPLTREQQDSLNADDCLIVYDDSTVFEFNSGVLGVQSFVGKQEFLDKRNKRKKK